MPEDGTLNRAELHTCDSSAVRGPGRGCRDLQEIVL